MTYDKLKQKLENYNWDDGFKVPCQLLSDANCDLALALEIFYLGDGYTYLISRELQAKYQEEWLEFIDRLYYDIVAGKYPKTEHPYQIPLTKVQRYQLEKTNTVKIFLTDL